MIAIVTYLLIVMLGTYGLIIVVEFAFSKNAKQFLIQLAFLFIVVVLLNFTTDFPQIRRSFGGTSPLIAIGIMFLCVAFGITARYVFYLKGEFSWRALAKPLVISPIVLLPLVGSVQASADLQTIQVISLAILSFQNGFFWVTVLERATQDT